ncbi:primosomal replication protein PriC [Vibrio sp. E150_011]
MRLTDLHARLDVLRRSASALDAQRQKHAPALFDQQLFNSPSRLLSPCVQEAKENLRQLSSPDLHANKAQYLSERFVAQLEALERALASSSLAAAGNHTTPINELNASLEQHKVWEIRLCDMVRQKEVQYKSAPHNVALEQAWRTAEQRLQRCRSAILNIEHQISESEKFL